MQRYDASLTNALKARAGELGFPLVGIAPAARPDTLPHLHRWLDAELHGEMGYLHRRRAAYEHPEQVQRGVKSVVMLGSTYDPPTPPVPGHTTPRIAAYAQGTADYHSVLRTQLEHLADWLHTQQPHARTRIAIDTAPLLERDFARRAGLGWFGKNTMLINKRLGSYFFLAALLTDIELDPDPPHESSHCGTCTRCLDVCPTDALIAPYVLDARRCISYLTIELREQSIPDERRDGLENWVFGCDLCQEVCPWNRRAPQASLPEFRALEQWQRIDLGAWFRLSVAEFTDLISGTPLERQGRNGLLRNAAIVLGNLGDRQAIASLRCGLAEPSLEVREAVVWALQKLGEAAL